MKNYIKEYLTDYNDNFQGAPCDEIIEMVEDVVKDFMNDGMTLEDAVQETCEQMFD